MRRRLPSYTLLPDILRRLNTGSSEPFTDYENLKYLVAVKLDAAESLRDSPLRFLEPHGGYYARGYSRPALPGDASETIAAALASTSRA